MINCVKIVVPALMLLVLFQISNIESKSLSALKPSSKEDDSNTDGGSYQPMAKPMRINTFFDEQSTCIMACDKCAREDPHYFKVS